MSIEPMRIFFKEIKEPIETTMIGNYAVAGGVTQTDPDVICAFPITPQTQSVEGLSDVVHQGRLKAAFINVELVIQLRHVLQELEHLQLPHLKVIY